MQSFGWKQYTMSFNDGDPCYFDIYCDPDSMSYNGINGYDYDDESEDSDERQIFSDIEPALNECSKILYELGEDLLLEMFDDGVEVTIYRDRVETDWCDHD